jgi:hypothetical protein
MPMRLLALDKSSPQAVRRSLDWAMPKRSSRAEVEDRWHRTPGRDEAVPHPSDSADTAHWCMDSKHGSPGTQVTTRAPWSGLAVACTVS